MQVLGVEHGDDGDRQQVVHHRQGEQEGPQRGRQVGGDHRENGQGESDVGRRRDRPALGPVPPAITRYSTAGTIIPPTAAATGTDGPLRVPQVAGDELALELQPGDEEEDRQQPVGRPGRQRQVQVQRRRPDLGVEQREVAVRPGRVRPDHRDDGGQRAAARRRRSPCAGRRRCARSRSRSRARTGRWSRWPRAPPRAEQAGPTRRPGFPAHPSAEGSRHGSA